VGGSFAGLIAINYLDSSSFNVILVDRKSFFEYTPNFPFLLSDPNHIDEMTCSLQDYADQYKCQFVQGQLDDLFANKAVIRVSAHKTIDIQFDYCVISTGSSYASSVKPEKEITSIQQRKQQVLLQAEKLQYFKKVLVVGGGIVGVEIAGVLSDHYKNLKVHLWNKSKQILSQYPEKARALCEQILKKQGVQIEFNKEVNELPQQQFDQIFDCRGNVYQPSFMTNNFSHYIDERGRIIVDENYRLKDNGNIFCVGDACITPNNESKMGYNASIQGMYAAENIVLLEKKSKSLKKLEGDANVSLIALNKKNAIFCFGDSVSEKSTSDKFTYEKKTIKAFKGSGFYKFISKFSRSILVMISGCQKRKKPAVNTNQVQDSQSKKENNL
ncbi:hypothetical protein ABPG74_021120, partial [Tetrahymena malaccensis]